MSINDAERGDLGERITARRERLFNTKKAAYQEAKVNAATWDKAEAGEKVRPDLLRLIVRTLWPESEGDWTLIDRTSEVSEAAVIAELVARMATFEDRLTELYKAQQASQATPEDEKQAEGGSSA